MISPSQEQLSLLNRRERFAYKIADWCNQNCKQLLITYNRSVMFMIIWLCMSRRLNVHGLDRVQDLDRDSRVILVANHRSFYDFFVATWVNYTYTNMSRRIFYPVRSTFFYDSIFGPLINIFLSGFSMFPPIMRDRSKKGFNRYSMERTIAEINDSGVVIGFHPEGTRNKSPDLFSFLPARYGVGEIIMHSPKVKVVPIFVLGMTSNLAREFISNWFYAKKVQIHIHYGSVIDLEEMHEEEPNMSSYLKAAELCMDAIKELSEEHQANFSVQQNSEPNG